MCNKSNDSSQLKAKDNSCEQKLYISSDKGIETMEVKKNTDIHDTNISECDKEYSITCCCMNCGLCGKAVCICVTGCCDGSTLLTLNIGIFGS
jgi:hypothetical protein